jgi:hypothetical protein
MTRISRRTFLTAAGTAAVLGARPRSEALGVRSAVPHPGRTRHMTWE